MNRKLSKTEIEEFNLQQKSSKFHPLTCDRKAESCEVRKDNLKQGSLIATEDYLICPCGEYKQFLTDYKWIKNG